MSKLAQELPSSNFGKTPLKGPRSACSLVYGDCDLEDYEAVVALKEQGLTWEQIQDQVDRILNIEDKIPTKKFTYHWRQMCTCWRSN